MDIVEEFEAVVAAPSIRLDEAMLVIASLGDADVDRAHYLRRIDDLAAGCADHTGAGVARHLFADELFSGNTSNYYDDRNSYLDQVIERRVGIPISLAVLAMAVGDRLGAELRCIGLPGHVLLRDMQHDIDLPFIDAFGGGVRLDREGVERFFAERNGGAALDPMFLSPLATPAVLFRVLNNLKMIFANRRDGGRVRTALELQVRLPGCPPGVRRELANVLTHAGQYDAAARQLETVRGERADSALAAEIDRLRARLN